MFKKHYFEINNQMLVVGLHLLNIGWCGVSISNACCCKSNFYDQDSILIIAHPLFFTVLGQHRNFCKPPGGSSRESLELKLRALVAINSGHFEITTRLFTSQTSRMIVESSLYIKFVVKCFSITKTNIEYVKNGTKLQWLELMEISQTWGVHNKNDSS